MYKQVIFLDADGVLWPDFGPGSILTSQNIGRDSLREFSTILNSRDSYFISIVTNQTFAARGMMPFDIFSEYVELYFENLIDDGLIDNFDVCFHHPRANFLGLRKVCHCRKPSPGMLLNAFSKSNLSNSHSYLIGDRITDLLAADAAGVPHKILISGDNSMEMNDSGGVVMEFSSLVDFSLVDNLNEAASVINWIREHDK